MSDCGGLREDIKSPQDCGNLGKALFQGVTERCELGNILTEEEAKRAILSYWLQAAEAQMR